MLVKTLSRGDYIRQQSAKTVYNAISAKEELGTYKPVRPMDAGIYVSKYKRGKVLTASS